jgi:hypothetical protein
VRKEDATDTEVVPTSIARTPTSTTSTAAADEALKGMQGNNSDDLATDQETGDGDSGGEKAGSP